MESDEKLTELLSKMPATPPRMWSIKNFLCLLDHVDLQIYKPLFGFFFLSKTPNIDFLLFRIRKH